MAADVLNNFQEINIETPVDVIIRQIKHLITSGQLKPGDRLPPERKLAERLGVGRTNVRDAIRKLEFYGILRTMPQSGTVVAGMGLTALEGLISNVLHIDDSHFSSLVETRVLLETESARMAALRRTEQDIAEIEAALEAYKEKVDAGEQAVEEDLKFHLRIAEAGKNPVLRSLMQIITPDIIKNYVQLEVCTNARIRRADVDHRVIVEHIIKKESALAAQAMQAHLQDVLDYSRQMHDRDNNL